LEANPAFRTRFFAKTKRAQTNASIGAKHVEKPIELLYKEAI
jgi:hypothetical protein